MERVSVFLITFCDLTDGKIWKGHDRSIINQGKANLRQAFTIECFYLELQPITKKEMRLRLMNRRIFTIS